MYPTDRGMCCTFNKQKAEAMFKESRYQTQIHKLTDQDKNLSFENSSIPSWLVIQNLFQINLAGKVPYIF